MAGFAEELEKMLVETDGWQAVMESTAEAIPVHRDVHDLSLQITILLGKLKVAAIAKLKRLAMECKFWEPAEGGDNEDTQI